MGYLGNESFGEITLDDYRSALESLRLYLGVQTPVQMPLPGEHPLTQLLMKVSVSSSTLQDCEHAGGHPIDGNKSAEHLSPLAPPAALTPAPFPTAQAAPRKRAPSAMEQQPPARAPRPKSGEQIPAAVVVNPPKAAPSTSPRMDPGASPHKVAVGDDAYGIEQISCEGTSGAWILLFSGNIKGVGKETVSIQAKKRYGVRYWPQEEGIDTSAWWCVPRRRFCYAEVGFADWGGKMRADQTFWARQDRVFPVHLRLPLGLAPIIKQQCGF